MWKWMAIKNTDPSPDRYPEILLYKHDGFMLNPVLLPYLPPIRRSAFRPYPNPLNKTVFFA